MVLFDRCRTFLIVFRLVNKPKNKRITFYDGKQMSNILISCNSSVWVKLHEEIVMTLIEQICWQFLLQLVLVQLLKESAVKIRSYIVNDY